MERGRGAVRAKTDGVQRASIGGCAVLTAWVAVLPAVPRHARAIASPRSVRRAVQLALTGRDQARVATSGHKSISVPQFHGAS